VYFTWNYSPYNGVQRGGKMNIPVVEVQPSMVRPNETRSLGRELAELVDEWSVTPNGAKSEEIASEMIGKARELLRKSTPLPQVSRPV
jgi:hypothetical protein